jgi:hypothetical protein
MTPLQKVEHDFVTNRSVSTERFPLDKTKPYWQVVSPLLGIVRGVKWTNDE